MQSQRLLLCLLFRHLFLGDFINRHLHERVGLNEYRAVLRVQGQILLDAGLSLFRFPVPRLKSRCRIPIDCDAVCRYNRVFRLLRGKPVIKGWHLALLGKSLNIRTRQYGRHDTRLNLFRRMESGASEHHIQKIAAQAMLLAGNVSSSRS
jgi:hypothetical protein